MTWSATAGVSRGHISALEYTIVFADTLIPIIGIFKLIYHKNHVMADFNMVSVTKTRVLFSRSIISRDCFSNVCTLFLLYIQRSSSQVKFDYKTFHAVQSGLKHGIKLSVPFTLVRFISFINCLISILDCNLSFLVIANH